MAVLPWFTPRKVPGTILMPEIKLRTVVYRQGSYLLYYLPESQYIFRERVILIQMFSELFLVSVLSDRS